MPDTVTVKVVCPLCEHEQDMTPDEARQYAGAINAAADNMPTDIFPNLSQVAVRMPPVGQG